MSAAPRVNAAGGVYGTDEPMPKPAPYPQGARLVRKSDGLEVVIICSFAGRQGTGEKSLDERDEPFTDHTTHGYSMYINASIPAENPVRDYMTGRKVLIRATDAKEWRRVS